jgi:hypothetical protein
MITATLLGGADQISVDQCVQQTGMSEGDCNFLLMEIGGQPNIYYMIARAALLKYGAKACAEYVQAQTGVPKHIAFVGCDWTIRKIWEYGGKAMTYGGPEWRSLYAAGSKGLHWRPCASPSELEPGEHWVPAVGGTPARCQLNIAILKKKGEPMSIVYVPCLWMTGMQGKDRTVCRDKDGVIRPVDKGHQGSPVRFYTGFFGKRLDVWPGHFEQNPWVSPISTSDLLTRFKRPMATQQTAYRAPPSTTPGSEYPTGTVAKRVGDKWLVAIPKATLSGEGDYTVTETTIDPAKRGARVVSAWRFDYMTGKRSWYETPPAWAGFGVLGVAAIGGAVIYQRKRGR